MCSYAKAYVAETEDVEICYPLESYEQNHGNTGMEVITQVCDTKTCLQCWNPLIVLLLLQE